MFNFNLKSKSLAVIVGVSAFSITGYLLLLLFRSKDNRSKDDEYLDNVSNSTYYRTVEIKIPKDMVRVVIGRNGNNIRLIQEQSNTKIRFRDSPNEASEERICVVRGTRECCAIAEHLISEFISSQPKLESVELWVPQLSVGRIIGRCGEQIHEIQSLSGTKINISDENREDLSRCIVIKGTTEQINIAKAFIEDIVQDFQNNTKNMGLVLSKRVPRAPSRINSGPKPVCNSPKSERFSPLLHQPDSQFEVYVSAVADPSHFWLQIVGPKATELDKLVEEMTEYYSDPANRSNHVPRKCEKGDLVAAIFNYDGKWYRAEVLDVQDGNDELNEGKKAELYYVDYGDMELVKVEDVYELRTDFLTLHFQAIECYLANVEPVGESWSREAVEYFEELTHVAQWKKLSAKINGYCSRERLRAKREGSPVPGVELYDIEDNRDVDVAKAMVNKGYAMYKRRSSSPNNGSNHAEAAGQ